MGGRRSCCSGQSKDSGTPQRGPTDGRVQISPHSRPPRHPGEVSCLATLHNLSESPWDVAPTVLIRESLIRLREPSGLSQEYCLRSQQVKGNEHKVFGEEAQDWCRGCAGCMCGKPEARTCGDTLAVPCRLTWP